MEERHWDVMTTMVASSLYTTAQILVAVAVAIEEVAGLTMEEGVEEGPITATTKLLLRSRTGHHPVGFLLPLVQQDSDMVLLHHQEQLASVWVCLLRHQRIMEVVVHMMATVVATRDNKVAIGTAVISQGHRLGATMAHRPVAAMAMGATSAIDG